MAKLAFLGLGAMGSRMAARLIAAGHEVTVWNRSPAATEALAAAGATVARSPRAAVTGAQAVFSMVRDDDAAKSVWLGEAGALAGMEPDAIGVECSTLSLPGVRHLNEAFAKADRSLVEAPLAGSRPQAEAGALIFLTGGAAQDVEQIGPLLLAMGSAVHHVGPVGAGCLAKLYVNAMFGAQLALTAEFLGVMEGAGIAPEPVLAAFGETPVASPAAKASAQAMLGQDFPPAFPIDLVAKDFALVGRTAAGCGAVVPVTSAVGAVYADARDQGLAGLNITGIVRHFRP